MSARFPESAIVADCYESNEALIIRLDVADRDSVEVLRRTFADLANGNRQDVDLAKLPSVTFMTRFVLKMECIASTHVRKVLYRTKDSPVEFTWKAPSDVWSDYEAFVDRLIECDSGGHQYLTDELIDDAVVEVAYKEPSSRIWRMTLPTASD